MNRLCRSRRDADLFDDADAELGIREAVPRQGDCQRRSHRRNIRRPDHSYVRPAMSATQHGTAAPATAGQQRDLLLSIPDVDASAPIRTRPLIPSRRRCTKTALLSPEVRVHPDCREVTGRVHGLQRMTQGSSRIVDAPSGCRRIMPGLPQTLLRA
jgi:hypothetical protein